MRRLRAALIRLGNLFRRRRHERELAEELESHLQMHIEDNLRRGMTPAEARRQANIKLGGLEQTKEECRDAWGLRFVNELAQDLRYGLRQLRRNPGFTAVAVLTLALGIGANTAIFSLIDAVMLRSIPVHDPSGLVVLRWNAHHQGSFGSSSMFGDCYGELERANVSGCSLPYPFFQWVHSDQELFSGVTAFAGPTQLVLGGNGPARMASGEVVSGDYFSTLGVKAVAGRTLDPADDKPSAAPAVVLSYAFWQSAFGGDRSAVGRTILLNSVPFTIAGVAEPSFTHLAPGKTQDFWLSTAMASRLKISWATDHSLKNWWLVVLGRLKPGVRIQKAQAAVNVTFRNEMLHGSNPVWKTQDDPRIKLIPAQQGLTGLRGFYSKPLYVLMFAVGIILLIACANVAGLLLSRAAGRQKEMAVRLSVGAGRRRIMRQLLTESVLLSLAGGALGVLFAYSGVKLIIALVTAGPNRSFHYVVAPDWRVLTFTVAVSLLTGIIFGLAPAFRSSRLSLTTALKESAPTASATGKHGGGWFHLGKSLVVVQVVLSMAILVGAGLLVRTLQNLRDINPGFDTRNLLLFGIDPTLVNYKPAQAQRFYLELRERLAAVPGVTSASYSFPALLTGSLSMSGYRIEGQPEKKSVSADRLTIGPGFLRTMGIRLVGGRTFTAEDFQQAAEAAAAFTRAIKAEKSTVNPSGANSPAPAGPPIPMLVNQAFVRKYFPGQNPLGAHLTMPNSSGTGSGAALQKRPKLSWEIVGIVGNTKYNSLRREIHPAVYVPLTEGGAHFELRTARDPAALIPTVRRVVEHMNRNLPLFSIETQSQSISDLLMQERIIAQLSSLFGILALLLACIGLYGLLAYEMSRRRREIGIRMALGAEKHDVLRMVVGQGLKLALIGVAIGIAGALALTRFLASLLYGVTPTDPLTFVAVSLILIAVALLACYIPARRAAKVDPMVALRYE